jgi:hypothetical protein
LAILPFSNQFNRAAQTLRERVGLASAGRGVLIHLLVIGTFGIFLPWMRGIDFLDPVMLDAYACLGVLFAAPAAAQAFAVERPHSLADALARIAVSVIYGEVMAIAMLMAALATVHLTHLYFPIAPDLLGLIEANAFGLAASIAMAAIAGWITTRLSAGAARMMIRVIFLAALVVFFFRSRWLPDVVTTGALIALVIAALAILALRIELGRSA